MPDTLRNEPDVLAVAESRDFRTYHNFVRSCRNYMEGPLVNSMYKSYRVAIGDNVEPSSPEEAMPVLDDLLEFQLYSWAYRHLQRFKYHRPNLGIFAMVDAERDYLVSQLDVAASAAGDHLRLNPELEIPEYYRMVDFHQHTGGVWSDELAGIAYEFGRRTTNPAHMDPNLIYRMSYSQFPERMYNKVLDWGVGHGAGLIEWQKLHPESECYGVDLSGPCLKLAHKRACEHGYKTYLSQQDVEHLDFDDDTFDLAFHLFMFHEIPPINLKNALKEIHRVLKPGGIFAGPEFGLSGESAFVDVIRMSHAWTNNETYAVEWFKFDMEKAARDIGFSKTTIEPFKPLSKGDATTGEDTNRWSLYILEK